MPEKRFTNEPPAIALRPAENGTLVAEFCRKMDASKYLPVGGMRGMRSEASRSDDRERAALPARSVRGKAQSRILKSVAFNRPHSNCLEVSALLWIEKVADVFEGVPPVSNGRGVMKGDAPHPRPDDGRRRLI